MIVTGFLGYVLPFGQMSLWGATVITNLVSAVPWIGSDIVEFLWGGFSVNNATLNRFFALHFVLPFILAALVMMHMIALHDSAGSGNPLGISGNSDRLPFAPYYLFKDLITILLFIVALSIFVFFMPNLLGDSENFVMANPMQTPPAIVPEWYLLPFYAILRSIPNKLLGVIAMLSAILILLAMPFADLSRSRGLQFRPLSKIAFYIFIANFFILMILGAKHVESPYIEFGQISTVIYFAHFLIIVPFISLLENSLVELAVSVNANRRSLNHRRRSSLNRIWYNNPTVSLLGGVPISSRRSFHTSPVLRAPKKSKHEKELEKLDKALELKEITQQKLEEKLEKAEEAIREHDRSTQSLFDRRRDPNCGPEELEMVERWIEESSYSRMRLEDRRNEIAEVVEKFDELDRQWENEDNTQE